MEKIFILFLIISVSGLQTDYSDDFNRDNYDKYDLVYGRVIKNDLEEDKLRPCNFDDWQCIRKFLAKNSNCKPSFGPEPDPLILPVDKMYIPVVNLTITHTDLEIRGFRSAKISEFYVNKETGNLVIAINVQKLSQMSPKSYFTFQRTGKEAVIRSDSASVTYDSITYIAVIPKVPYLQLDRAEIHADVHDSTPVYAVGPAVMNSTDPDVKIGSAAFVANIPIIIQEAHAFQSNLLTTIYIQKYLCDFGLDSYKNYLTFLGTKAYTQNPPKRYVANSLYGINNVINKGNFDYNNIRNMKS